MVFKMFWLLFLSSFIASVVGGGLERPSNLPCGRDDAKCITDMFQWMFNSAILGNPAKGMENLDPLHQEIVEGNLGYVNYTLKKATIEGYAKCKAANVSFNSDVSLLKVKLACPLLRMNGDYVVDGKLLSFPIKGKGDFYASTTNNDILFDNKMVYYKQNKALHVKYETVKTDAEIFGELDIELRKLFNGNKELSDNIHRFAKENPKLFSSLIQEPYLKINIAKIVKNLNELFKEIPFTDLIQVNENNVKIEKN